MNKYMLLEAEPLTQDQIELAIKRAHTLRSEATWNVFVKLGNWISKKRQFHVQGGSDLAHSA